MIPKEKERHMHLHGTLSVLSRAEEDQLHRAALDVLEQTGVRVESPEIVARLAEFGAVPARDGERVTFPRSVVEAAIAASDDGWPPVARTMLPSAATNSCSA